MSKLSQKDRDIVLIEWIDAYECASGWLELEEALKTKPPTVYSIGFVLKEEKDYITICADLGREGDSDCGRVQVIPKTWVKKTILVDKS